MKNYIIVQFCILIIFTGCAGKSDNSGQSDQSSLAVEERFPIDGVVDFSKLGAVTEMELDRRIIPDDTLAGKTSIKWAVVNDDRDIYIAVEWSDETKNCEYLPGTGPTDYDAIFLDFDNDGNGTLADDENRYYMISAPNNKVISVDANHKTYDKDVFGNGISFMKYYPDEKKYQAEFLLPLTGDSDFEKISKNTKFNITLNDNRKLSLNTGFYSKINPDTSVNKWLTFPLTDSRDINRTPIPDNLQGLIIFVATGKVLTSANPSGETNTGPGEIYSFNPMTKEVKRITSNTNVYETGISLSHDRTKIVYMASSVDPEINPGAWNECEIYTINVDGSNQNKLTSNAFLDGHPAWSPDDDKIVFGFLDGYNGPHIMVMDADGGNKIDVTLWDTQASTHWYSEMDPDWLPDGRIIFKTNRGFNLEDYNANDFRLQIAVMNADGSNFQLQTNTEDVVDHDPISNPAGSYAVFERIHGNYDYQTIDGIFSRWTIEQVELNGSGEEKILVDNGWINWLPVYDPGGKYIVYFRDCGYVEARLVRLSDGKDLGRFIPGTTSFRYLDWK